jgi:hypothetical protein
MNPSLDLVSNYLNPPTRIGKLLLHNKKKDKGKGKMPFFEIAHFLEFAFF